MTAVEALMQAEIDRLRAELATHQESEFHPDWSMLSATRDSLAEHQDMIRRLSERVKVLEQLVIDAAYTMEGARIWNGMDWTYNPMHPFKHLPVLQRLNVERGKINDTRSALEAK